MLTVKTDPIYHQASFCIFTGRTDPVALQRLSLQKPTLEDAFIVLTGHSIRPDEASSRDQLRRTVRMRRRT